VADPPERNPNSMIAQLSDQGERVRTRSLQESRTQIKWATIDSSWVHDVDRAAFNVKLDQLRATQPKMVYSSHLPPAPGRMLDLFIQSLAQVPDAPRFEGPDQAALETMLAAMAGLPA
jgi:hypothetical protein